MSNIIEFLEKIGSEAQWRLASHDELQRAMDEAELRAPEREAILAKDVPRINRLLQQESLFGSMIPTFPAAFAEKQGDSVSLRQMNPITVSSGIDLVVPEQKQHYAFVVPSGIDLASLEQRPHCAMIIPSGIDLATLEQKALCAYVIPSGVDAATLNMQAS